MGRAESCSENKHRSRHRRSCEVGDVSLMAQIQMKHCVCAYKTTMILLRPSHCPSFPL